MNIILGGSSGEFSALQTCNARAEIQRENLHRYLLNIEDTIQVFFHEVSFDTKGQPYKMQATSLLSNRLLGTMSR